MDNWERIKELAEYDKAYRVWQQSYEQYRQDDAPAKGAACL